MEQQYLSYGGMGHPPNELVERFVASWYDRATVRRPQSWNVLLDELDPNTPDFLESLLPFRDDPAFRSSSRPVQAACLSAGWMIYNYKTIALETNIIIPACLDLMELSTSSRLSFREVGAISETITDEGFHTLVSAELCRLTASLRGLDFRVPAFDLTKNLSVHRSLVEPRQFSLIRLAYATVSEVFISDYLSLLSKEEGIQPLFRSAVALHKADEVGHKRLFPVLVRRVIDDCNEQQKDLFVKSVYEAVSAFASRETRVWADVLGQIYRSRVDCRDSDIPVCSELSGDADFGGVSELLKELKLENSRCETV